MTSLARDLELTLTSERTRYFVKEPIPLRLTLTNVTDAPVVGGFLLYVLSPKVTLEYRIGDGPFHTFPYTGEVRYLDTPEALEPAAEITDLRLIGFDPARGAFLLSEAGRYEFRATYSDRPFPPTPNSVVRSDVLVITARKPPSSEHEAFGAYTSRIARVVQFDPVFGGGSQADPLGLAGWSVTDELIREAVQFLDRFPRSLYAQSVRAGLERVLHHRSYGRTPLSAEHKALHRRLKAELGMRE